MRERAWARVQLDAINLAVTRGVVADGVGTAVVVQVHRHPDRHRARHGRRWRRPHVRVARARRTLRGGGRGILRRRSKVCGRLEGDIGRGRQPLDDLRRLRQLHVALLLRHAVWWRGVSVHVVSFTVWHGCRTADSSYPTVLERSSTIPTTAPPRAVQVLLRGLLTLSHTRQRPTATRRLLRVTTAVQ